MKTFYSSEKNVQLLIALLKEHNIRRVIASPGTTNVCFVASIQQDDFFEIYSSVDERSAAYMACGIAAETKEPVVLSCTGATASRNYLPGLTEAFYRKLPVLAITSSQPIGRIGSHMNQVIDRTVIQKDVAKLSVHIPMIHDQEEEWESVVKLNNAMLELRRRGCGPVHINLTTSYNVDFSVKELPKVRAIKRLYLRDEFPSLEGKRVGIFVGSHVAWDEKLTRAVETFCEKYNAVVLCDNGSNYKGKYGVWHSLIVYQKQYKPACGDMDVIIHIGDVSASYVYRPSEIWRVNPDGELRDTFKKLRYVYEMYELDFFEKCNEMAGSAKKNTSRYEEWNREYVELREKALNADLPFSNYWTASQMHDKLPKNSVLHLGILTSLRAWNFFKIDDSIRGYSNTGGFGIDGDISSLMGAALMNKDKTYIGIVGDLAFFYDMNSIGNRHLGNNIRIMVVNNGIGTEFKNNLNLATRSGIAEDTNTFIAAAGHYGKQSKNLLRHYAEDLGFEYFSADSKDTFLEGMKRFTTEEKLDKPVFFEVFTESDNETIALEKLQNLKVSMSGKTKEMAKKILGQKNFGELKKVMKK